MILRISGTQVAVLVIVSILLIVSSVHGRKHRLVVTDDVRSKFSVSSFGFLAGGRLDVTVNSLQVQPEDWTGGSPQVGFTLIRSSHIESPFNKGIPRPDTCYLKDPSITHSKQYVTMEIDNIAGSVILRCFNTGDLTFRHVLPRHSHYHSLDKRAILNAPSDIIMFTKVNHSASDRLSSSLIDSSVNSSSKAPLESNISADINGDGPALLGGQVKLSSPMPIVSNQLPKAVIDSERQKLPDNSLISSYDLSAGLKPNPEFVPEMRMNKSSAQSIDNLCSPSSLPLIYEVGPDNSTSVSFNFSLQLTRPEQEGFYFLTFHNCRALMHLNQNWLPWEVNMDVEVTEVNYPDNYLSANLMPLPQLYFALSVVFVLFGVIWVNFIRQQRNNTLKIHHLMTALVFVKAVSLMSRGINYHFIAIDGSPMEAWAYIYYTTRLLKGALFFITLVLIGSGWTFIKHMLHLRDKKLVFVIVCLQLVANLGEIVYDESVEGEIKRAFWHDLVGLVDLACCSAILFPIIWSVRHLQEASRTDGKAAINLRKMELFRHFYFTILCYIYFTRIISYLVSLIITFKYFWVTVLMEEGATLVFFVITGYYFQPMARNPYLLISQDEDYEMEDVLFSVGPLNKDGTVHSDNSTNEQSNWSVSDNQRLIKRDIEAA